MTHETLVARAVTWLRGQKLPLVLAGMASCAEIPDAIGFATRRTIVVEVKTSTADFLRDRAKYCDWIDENGTRFSMKTPLRHRKGFVPVRVETRPNMGSQRYYLCEPGVIDAGMVAERHPDHGLLHIHGRRVMKVVPAPQRSPSTRDIEAEVMYLQFALRHLTDNLGASGVTVDLLRATKMFGKGGITLAPWKVEQITKYGAAGPAKTREPLARDSL